MWSSYVILGASAKKSFLKSSKPLSSETPSKIKLSENVGGTAKLPKGAMVKGIGKSGKTDKTKSKGGKEVRCHLQNSLKNWHIFKIYILTSKLSSLEST